MVSIEFLRQFRLFDYAIFDFLAVFIGMAVLAPLLSKMFKKIGIHIPKMNWLILSLPIGILTHLLVGNITPMTRDFIDIQGHYLLKLVILGLVVFGIRGVKIVTKNKIDNS